MGKVFSGSFAQTFDATTHGGLTGWSGTDSMPGTWSAADWSTSDHSAAGWTDGSWTDTNWTGMGIDGNGLWGGQASLSGSDALHNGTVTLIDGGAGNDVLIGTAGVDVLRGGAGNDTITGGAGTDLLIGGAGNDVFKFAAGDAAFSTTGQSAHASDAIADFAIGADKIEIGFTPVAVLESSAASLSAAATAAQALLTAHAGTQEVAAVQVGHETYLFWNSAGTGDQVDSAVALIGVKAANLSIADFV